MTKILVTGAAGQVGCRLVRQLLARDYEVKGFILPDDPTRTRIEGLNIDVEEGNLLDADLAKIVSDVDAVIHTANLVNKPSWMTESEFFDNNVRGTFNVVHAASKRADTLERFVHISSNAVYGPPCYSPVDEEHPLCPKGLYPITKLLGEHVVSAHARETGLKTVIIRPSGTLSGTAALSRFSVGHVLYILKGYQKTELWQELEKAAESHDQPISITDEQGRPWLHRPVDARDVALASICALESPAAVGEAFNVAAPELISYPHAARIISEGSGQGILEWQVPFHWQEYDTSIRKAKSRIDYNPQWGIEEMVRSALAVQRGESNGMA